MSDDNKPEAKEHKMDFGPLIDLTPLPAEVVDHATNLFDTNLDGEISAQEARANDAHESLFQVLTKLGVSADDLALALGIESKAVREKRHEDNRKLHEEARLERTRFRKEWEDGQKFDASERERIRKEWEDGQKFDASERERIRKETPTPVVQEPAGAWSAKVTQKSKTELVLAITNGTKIKGIVYRTLTDTKTGKILSQGSRTISAGVTEEQVYNRSVGWPFTTLVVDLKLNHPDTGAKVEVK